MKKNKIPLWLFGGLLFILSSCLGNDEIGLNDRNLSNCQIATFSLSCDSISGLSTTKFTIDQVNGLIFNKDSLPYGTNVNFKVICTLTYAAGSITSVEVHQKAIDKKEYWNASDSLDFSDEVIFYIISYNGKESKSYTAKLNVHQQNPGLMEWSRDENPLPASRATDRKVILHGDSYLMYVKNADGYELYRSRVSDANNWTKQPLTGLSDNKTFTLSQITEYEDNLYLPSSDGALYCSAEGQDWTRVENTPEIVALPGTVCVAPELKRPSALSAVIRDGDAWLFAAMNISGQWQKGKEVPEGFPITGFASNSYTQMYYSHLVIVAGKDRNGGLSNKSWDTMDGLAWICLTGSGKNYFTQREGLMLADYDDKFYLTGGIDASNQGLKDIYTSADKGVTWALADSLTFLPETYQGRGFASMLVDKDNFVLLFGGKERNEANMSDELWRGRINRLGYKD
ncbi:MAG: DUF6242 domain-containing protein [Tannerella sp.]|jgi:hypothetical protein|nr:DUF6242 domain-containing protein [Tannerella sp.]